MRNARHYGLPGAPPRVSQRRSKPPAPAVVSTFAAGDTVRWNQRYTGVIQDVQDGEATVAETNPPLGGERLWRLSLDALTRR
jgi:hypothetical protein